MLVVDYIVETLVNRGIDTFFVLNGGAIAPLIDAISRNSAAKMHCFQHEQAASMAAEGFNRAEPNRAAVVAVTSGPGVQNVLNGVCGCYYDSIPTLIITGQVNVSESLGSIQAKPRQIGFQEMPVMECFRPFTKYIAKIMEPKVMARAIHIAVDEMYAGGRMGPCLLDIPVNVQMSEMDPVENEVEYSNGKGKNGVDECLDKINEIKDLISSASRPVFLVGNGARGARDAINALIYKLQVPVCAAWGGIDLFALDCDEAYALFLGPYGVYGDRAANIAIQNADVLVSLGARLDTRQTGGNLRAFSVESKKIVIDIDKEEIERLSQRGVKVTVGCTMDAGIFTSALSAVLNKPLEIDQWRVKLADWKVKLSIENRPSFPGFICPYAFLQKLNQMMASDAIIAVDTGATLVWCFQVLRAYTKNQRIFSNLGNSSMGYSLPAAIGAALAAPNRPVICVAGDGAFQQNIQELATVAAYNLNIKVFVFNNRGYGIIKQFQNTYLGARHAATSARDLYGKGGTAGFPDFVAIARGYGVPGQRLESVKDLTDDMLTAPGPAVYDLKINEEQDIRPKTEFGNSIENMTPLVDLPDDIFVAPPPRRKPTGWVKV